MKSPIKLLSTDFDGTLHAEFEDPPVPVRLQELIGQLQRQGAKWIINTGRDLPSLMEGMARARMSVKPDYLALVEREIYVHEGSQYVPLADWNARCDARHAELFVRLRGDVEELRAWIDQRFDATIYGDMWSPFCVITKTLEDMDAVQVFLEDYYQAAPDVAVVRNDVYLRFSHRDFNKGTALARIASLVGARPEETFAAGDHLNDLPMLSREFAGLLAAPANAVPAVKNSVRVQSGFVAEEPFGHGVFSALEHFLGGRGVH
ncbi:MAG: HAD family phosphatase [Verrucomicrobia bacterium]|nr:HAD family phosphatase [Verrucomicrobiota bacterium]